MRLNDRRRIDWKSACEKVEEIKEQKNRPENSSRIDNVNTYQLHLRLPFGASLCIVRLA
jgi:hypothetical protein